VITYDAFSYWYLVLEIKENLDTVKLNDLLRVIEHIVGTVTIPSGLNPKPTLLTTSMEVSLTHSCLKTPAFAVPSA
jgi:hypothetical protein